MRRADACEQWMRITWRVAASALLCLPMACSTSGAPRSSRIEFDGEAGFTVTEQSRFSSDVRSDFEKALRLLDKEDYEGGIELLERVVEAAPYATVAQIDLGIAYGAIEERERAVAVLEKAVLQSPRNPVAHNELGIAYRKVGRFEDARKSYENALDVYPDFHFARRNLAILCDVYLGDLECAMKHYALYTKMVPDDEKVVMWMTDLRNRTGK
jgi:Flp pilus assembly protein TadD